MTGIPQSVGAGQGLEVSHRTTKPDLVSEMDGARKTSILVGGACRIGPRGAGAGDLTWWDRALV